MADATIDFDANTAGWPVRGHLVKLDPPLKRFDPETGDPVLYEHVVVVVKEVDRYGNQGAGVDVFPSNAEAGFVSDTMAPIKRMALKPLHSALIELGYTPTN